MTVDSEIEILGRLQGIEKHLARMETALIGDPEVGHKGVVTRLENLELLNAETPSGHLEMEERARQARAKIHERIDEMEEATDERLNSLVDEWKRAKYLATGAALGAGIAGGGVGAWLTTLLPG